MNKIGKSVLLSAFLSCSAISPVFAQMMAQEAVSSGDETIQIPKMLQRPAADPVEDPVGDNLGNHRAEQTLDLRGNVITGLGMPIDLNGEVQDMSAGVNVWYLHNYVRDHSPDSGDNLGDHTATQDINISGYQIRNVANAYGGNAGDAVNVWTLQRYLDDIPGDNLGNHIASADLFLNNQSIYLGPITNFDPLTGAPTTTTGVRISPTMITGLQTPQNGADAANKAYVDSAISSIDLSNVVYTINNQTINGIKTFTQVLNANGGVNAGGQRITNVANPVASSDAVNLGTLNAAISGNAYTAGAGIAISPTRVVSVDSTVVRTTGNQSISGFKTFSSVMTLMSPDAVILRMADHFNQVRASIQHEHLTNSLMLINNGGAVFPQTVTTQLDLKSDGRIMPIVGRFDANNRVISTVADPVSAQDAVNLRTLQAAVGAAGGVYTGGSGIDISGTNVISADATVVRTTGAQDISGNKNFNSGNLIVSAAGNKHVWFRDTASTPLALVYHQPSDESLNMRTYASNGTTVTAQLTVRGPSGLIQPTVGRFDANNRTISTVADPAQPQDAVNLRTLQAAVGAAGGVYTGGSGIDISGTNVITADTTVVRTSGNQTIDGLKTLLSSLNMTADGDRAIWFRRADNTQRVGLYSTAADNSFRVLTYDDTGVFQAGLRVRGTDGAIYPEGTGFFHANGRKIVSVADPTVSTDAVNLRTMQAAIANAYTGGSGIDISSTNVITADATVVRTTGTQTVGGAKTFSSTVDITTANQLRLRSGTAGTGVILRNDGTNFYVMLTDVNAPTASYNSLRPFYINGATGGVTIGTTLNVDGTSASPDLVIRRTNSSVNANMRFFTTGADDVTIGQGDNGWFNVGAGDDITYAQTGSFRVRASDGRMEWGGVAAGNGSGITSLNASNLSTGTVSTARLPSNIVYTDRTIATGTGIDGGGNLSANRTFSLAAEYIRRSAGTNSLGVMAFNGHTSAGGQFYGGTTNPSGTTRLNYAGNFYATNMWSTAYYYFSDERLKKDIETLGADTATEIIKGLRPVSYTWKETDKPALGMIAQEVREVVPTAVIENEGGDLAVDYVQMIAPMVAAMQEMEARIQSLEAELATHRQ